MPDSTDRPFLRPIPYPFPLIPAAELRGGDLLHLSGTSYALVAHVRAVDDVWIEISVYDGDHPQPLPPLRRRDHALRVVQHGIAPPHTPQAAPEQARRRQTALALMDRVRNRIGPVPDFDEDVNAADLDHGGFDVDAAIDLIRGPRSGPPTMSPGRFTAPSVPSVLQVQADHRSDGPLLLDTNQPAVRAILALFAEIKDNDDNDGWNGGDTVDILTRWLLRIGIDPELDPVQLEPRFARDIATAHLATAHLAAAVRAAAPAAAEANNPGDDVDLDQVAQLVRAAGVECVVDTPGGGVAVLVAGPPRTGPRWASPWAAHAGPGRYRWGRPSTASTADLTVGPDDGGQVPPTGVASVGAMTELQIAALIVAQTRIEDPSSPLGHDDLEAIGLRCPIRKG